MFAFDISMKILTYHAFQLGIAFILSLPIALNRELEDNGAGLRTFPLVTIASCAFMLVGMDIYQGSDAEARIMYAIITVWVLLVVGLFLKTRMGQKARQPPLGYGIQRQLVSRSPMGAMKLPLFSQLLDLSFCNSPNPLSQSIGAKIDN